jgi:deoxyribodipyrimidine photolyase-related protein
LNSYPKMLVLHPNQLFAVKLLHENQVVLYEHPDFFTKYKFNRLKLVLHRASMKLYQKYLQKAGISVTYKTFKDAPPKGPTPFQPNLKNQKLEQRQSPNFLCLELFDEYRKKTDKFFFSNFYAWMKKKLNILPNVTSQDKNNRQAMKKPPRIAQNKVKLSKEEHTELLSAIKYVKLHFKNNPGPDWNQIYVEWNIPLTHAHAKSLVNFFLKNKAKHFGPFQDYMYFDGREGNIMFHSFLSSSLNIGLLQPGDLLGILDLKIPMGSKEGFIRQLFWREYQLFCYMYADLNINGNRYGGKKKIDSDWYHGTTNILPIDHCIKKAFATGYLHHIERLMIMGNFMLLYGIVPREAFKWFMEFSIDSYEWVMYQNVLDMVFNVSGGKTMRRIYISSSNYILKMSDLKKAEWCDEWDKLFRAFIVRHKISYPYNSK